MKFTTAGTTDVSDIAAAKLYFTDHTANFSDANQVASVTTVADGENVMALEAPIEVKEQKLPETPIREGFTLVEWGGTIL